MVKILITAPKGKMDRLIVKEAAGRDGIAVVGGLGPFGRDYIGKDVGTAAGLLEPVGALVYEDLEDIIEECDMVVDFSTTELSMKVLSCCLAHKKALICGTTGFTREQEKALHDAAKEIPVLAAANTSYVSNIMKRIAAIAASALDEKAKIEIIDYHDEKKVDAPSGTAKEYAAEMAAHCGKNVEDMDFHSIRAGDISSTHTILFGCMGERLEITHRSYNWECYARGACDAVLFMEDKAAGLYTMEDVIGI